MWDSQPGNRPLKGVVEFRKVPINCERRLVQRKCSHIAGVKSPDL